MSLGLFGSKAFVPYLSFAATFACGFASSSGSKSTLCGQSGWTSLFSKNHPDLAMGINDAVALTGLVDSIALSVDVATASATSVMLGGGTISTASYLWTTCVMGPANLTCDVALALIAYTVANDIFSAISDIWGSSKFKGSLLPRPGALDGLGSSATGIPNKNLSLQEILGQLSTGAISTPTP